MSPTKYRFCNFTKTKTESIGKGLGFRKMTPQSISAQFVCVGHFVKRSNRFAYTVETLFDNAVITRRSVNCVYRIGIYSGKLKSLSPRSTPYLHIRIFFPESDTIIHSVPPINPIVCYLTTCSRFLAMCSHHISQMSMRNSTVSILYLTHEYFGVYYLWDICVCRWTQKST